jgi:HD-GYP domain-containing protein (c-di-GMP phosphodiesterase class II)
VTREESALAIKQIKLAVNEVTLGMFISGLDRPWTQTPFPLQGFYVREQDEIKELKLHCRHVYIDVIKGVGPLKTRLKTLADSRPVGRKEVRSTAAAKPPLVTPIKIRRGVYPTTVLPIGKELEKAKELHRVVYTAVHSVLEEIGVGVSSASLVETTRAAGLMVDSVIRSPDAFTWLSRVRAKDEYTYSHAVRSAVWGILFGRHIGLAKADLDILAVGILLKDIGKTRIPKHILEQVARSDSERQVYESFVDYGVEILRKLPDIPPRVTAVVKTHCERINGSGFPEHLRGDRIPVLGKVAGIVTFYDETVNPRGQLHPLSPSKAVAKLYELRGVEFQSDLVVEFIRAIGLYPTGTLVQLNTGEVAVVVEQNFQRRLKPKVMVVTDAYKQLLPEPVYLDMAEDDRAKQVLFDSGKTAEISRIEIVQDLEPGAIDIDLAAIRDQYIDRQASTTLFSFLKRKAPIPSLFGH